METKAIKLTIFHTLSMTLLLLSIACQGRGNMQQTQNVSADSMELDSADFIEEDSLLAVVKIHVDYFTGSSPLAKSVRSYIIKNLQDLAKEYMQEEDSSQSKHDASSLQRNDTRDEIQQATNLCGKKIYKELSDIARETYNESVRYGYAAPLPYVMEERLRLLYATDNYVTFQLTYYQFSGGAHGMYGEKGISFVRRTGELLTQVVDTLKLEAIQPIIKAGICEYLNKLYDGEGDAENDSITPSSLGQYLFDFAFQDGCIPLPACTPTLTPQGVQFIYNQYEIAPYAVGNPTFTVPYAKIKPYLTPQVRVLLP